MKKRTKLIAFVAMWIVWAAILVAVIVTDGSSLWLMAVHWAACAVVGWTTGWVLPAWLTTWLKSRKTSRDV
ncbi:membrane protein [Mycobacterium phage Sejanus]|nr:membrane protein [Mycobacterium phage Sejanus]